MRGFTKWLLVVTVVGSSLALAGGVYHAQCVGCHQQEAQGIPGAFPPLAGHIPEILAAKGGRDYLIQVVLYGLTGEISVKGQKYNGAMPAWGAQLKDEQIAEVLNQLATMWGNDKLLPKGHKEFTVAEVKAMKAKAMTPQQVYAARQKLGLK